MKAYVYVSLKKSVLDPQGKTIHGALTKIGYKSLHDVRQGKYFEITLNGGISKDEERTQSLKSFVSPSKSRSPFCVTVPEPSPVPHRSSRQGAN